MGTTALFVMDVQQGIADRFHDPDYLPRLGRTIGTARAAGIPVIYVLVGFRQGYPEVSDRNKGFSAIAARGGVVIGDPAKAVHPDVALEAGEVVVTKRRVSAFSGGDLKVA